MNYRQLFVLVEGNDAHRFFETIIKPLYIQTYNWVEVRTFAQQKPLKVNALIRSIKAMGADYIFAHDHDDRPCITSCKEYVGRHYSEVETDRIIIVKGEIESWYCAGVDTATCQKLRISYHDNTDGLRKEHIEQMVAGLPITRVPLLIEMLKNYSLSTATDRNSSMKYLLSNRKFGLSP